jgi:hypothetical protein
MAQGKAKLRLPHFAGEQFPDKKSGKARDQQRCSVPSYLSGPPFPGTQGEN